MAYHEPQEFIGSAFARVGVMHSATKPVLIHSTMVRGLSCLPHVSLMQISSVMTPLLKMSAVFSGSGDSAEICNSVYVVEILDTGRLSDLKLL